ncbi:NYN domain-containing protein [Scytonema hofmannii FACHB-248]|uniref:NYN domain-containing protein n=1 Tax=Scytonema hofmannii FACHB-248 TaxID=1842502 RepID=A0ABR8GXQ9_9CYAN|nr:MULTISPECIES: NYN domain-containing protein [Nostocales]MBD2608336.1 NYN domain-containing protein [Scytonema hofmannii FACHB-248]
MELLLTTYDSALFNKIGFYVGQAIIAIQDKQPELLLEKYRNVPWNSRHQFSLTAKLTEILRQSNDWDTLINTLQGFLKVLLIPESFNSPILIKLIEDIRLLNPAKPELNGSNSLNTIKPVSSEIVTNGSLSQTKIAVLLLDAENLQINAETEQFLTTVCTCPIQVKIAFANWRSMGKLDIEFHQRGYDLIHVPAGKDNADGKMIAFGSSIHEHYPKAKEVLVCSSDTVMTNLCNHLQQNGLTVYQVNKQGNNVTVVNISTGKNYNYSLNILPKIPTIEQFIHQLKELIKVEQKRTENCWVELATLSQMFKDKYQLTITQIVSKHLPGKKARDIFVNYPTEFVVHQMSEQSELYVTLFEINQVQQVDTSNDDVQQTNVASLSSINSKTDLEEALKNIIKKLTTQSSNSYICIGILGSKFSQQYGKSITNQIKCLHLSGNYMKFLQSCDSLELQKTGDRWHVALRQTKSVTA